MMMHGLANFEVMSIILGVKWVIKIKVGPLIFVVYRVWGFSHNG